jgi:enoyl-CoA hydratase/carnithine racemase
MPATRFVGPPPGSLHLSSIDSGPCPRRLLLTGDTITAATVEPMGVFTEFAEDSEVEARARWWAQKVAKCPPTGS